MFLYNRILHCQPEHQIQYFYPERTASKFYVHKYFKRLLLVAGHMDSPVIQSDCRFPWIISNSPRHWTLEPYRYVLVCWSSWGIFKESQLILMRLIDVVQGWSWKFILLWSLRDSFILNKGLKMDGQKLIPKGGQKPNYMSPLCGWLTPLLSWPAPCHPAILRTIPPPPVPPLRYPMHHHITAPFYVTWLPPRCCALYLVRSTIIL